MMRNAIALVVGLMLALGGASALAEMDHSGHGSSSTKTKKMDHGSMGHGGMSHGKDMDAMHTQMQALHDHSKMMEGMKDGAALRDEMKKHMRMMDEMMEMMMQHTMKSGVSSQPGS